MSETSRIEKLFRLCKIVFNPKTLKQRHLNKIVLVPSKLLYILRQLN